MSSDYFFKKWKSTLSRLDDVVKIDKFFQESKSHDKTLCEASERLSGMLAQYIAVFNEALDCKQHNLQVQKVPFYEKLVHAISLRILELKNELRKLDGSNYQFLSTAMKNNKLTPYDIEFAGVPDEAERPEELEAKLKEIFKAVKEEKERIELEKLKENEKEVDTNCWWDTDEEKHEVKTEEKEKLTEEELKTREMASLIQAHEKCRQVICERTLKNRQREKWVKELNGTLPSPARFDLKTRAAKLIQMACRIYFEQKRKNYEESNRDKVLGLKYCEPPKTIQKSYELKLQRNEKRKKYMKDWKISFEKIRLKYLNEEVVELKEYYRDLIRDWFHFWFEEIQYFHDIPDEKEGGVVAIIKDETPVPRVWLEENKKKLEQLKANKGKTSQELKFAAQEAKREQMLLKKEEQLKQKQQAAFMKKLMKSPQQHPGYHYPKSLKMNDIEEAMEDYHKQWDNLDFTAIKNVKERFINELDLDEVCKDVKIEVTNYVIDDMNEELKLLKTALRADCERNGEQMLEPIKPKAKKEKKKRKLRAVMSENIAEQLHALAMKDILREYPHTTLEDYLGDHNLVGDNVRCNYGQALPYAGETRSLWWERCREVVLGNQKVLIVGPKGSGKMKLVYAMASLNDAVLFEIDPCEIPEITAAYLQPLMTSVAKCAQVTQPSVICIKNIHRLFYSKTPPELVEINTDMLKNYLVQKLCKRLNKTDNITVIGTCEDPWLANATLLKQFPAVVPLPDTMYSTVYKILYDWVTNNHCVPDDLDIHSLARVLQGYSFGYIKQCLQNFLTPEKIVHIGAHGLKPQDVYNYFVEDNKDKIEYDKYLKWYFDKTTWGIKEKQHREEQLEFKAALDKYEEKMKKKKPKSTASTGHL